VYWEPEQQRLAAGSRGPRGWRRWIGLGLLRAAERFRRIKHHRELGTLLAAFGAVPVAEHAGEPSRRPSPNQRAPQWAQDRTSRGGRYVGTPLPCRELRV
jgi:hypothetical protein